MKLADALKAIDQAASDVLATQFKNIFSSSLSENAKQADDQLSEGFDRLDAFHAKAIEIAKKKFKD